MPDPVPTQTGTLRAEYDADHHVLYVYFPNHPNTKGCVKHTADDSSGVLYDIGQDDTVIGIEVMLAGPLEFVVSLRRDHAMTHPTQSGTVPNRRAAPVDKPGACSACRALYRLGHYPDCEVDQAESVAAAYRQALSDIRAEVSHGITANWEYIEKRFAEALDRA